MKIVKQLYTYFIFGEGRSDIKFVTKLIEHPKFGYHTKKWSFNYDNASGSSVETIVKQCHQAILSRDYNLVLCILDVDQLKHLCQSLSLVYRWLGLFKKLFVNSNGGTLPILVCNLS